MPCVVEEEGWLKYGDSTSVGAADSGMVDAGAIL